MALALLHQIDQKRPIGRFTFRDSTASSLKSRSMDGMRRDRSRHHPNHGVKIAFRQKHGGELCVLDDIDETDVNAIYVWSGTLCQKTYYGKLCERERG